MLPVPVPLLQRSAKQRGLFQHAGVFSEAELSVYSILENSSHSLVILAVLRLSHTSSWRGLERASPGNVIKMAKPSLEGGKYTWQSRREKPNGP